MFYEYLGKVLPCGACSKHYAQHFEKIPIEKYTDSKDKLFEWTVLLHNTVNASLGKQQYSLQQARELYDKLHVSSLPGFSNVTLVVSLVGTLIIMLFFARRYMLKS
jgi:hypothetical protein